MKSTVTPRIVQPAPHETHKETRARQARSARKGAFGGVEIRRASDRAVHDLRGPLRNIGLLVDMLPDAPDQLDGGEFSAAKRQILTCVEMGRTVIAGVERLTQAAFAELAPRPAPVWGLIDAAAQRAFPTTARPPIERVADGAPWCQVDPEAMTLVFRELFENAAHHADNGDVALRIEAVDGANGLLVSVSDTGGPVPTAVRERAFEPFFRMKKQVGGRHRAGVGLSVCRAIVERHGGAMWCDEADGPQPGFRLRMTLPQAEPSNNAFVGEP